MKKLLLVTHSFPPSTGALSIRGGYIAKGLSERGWKVVVLVVAPPNVKGDDSLESVLPKCIDIYRITVAKSHFFPWLWTALMGIKKIVRSYASFDVIYGLGNLGGLTVFLNKGKSFWKLRVVDFIDPWALNPRRALSVCRRAIISVIERAVINSAHITFVNTPEMRELYIKHYSIEPQKLKVLSMGYDEALFRSEPHKFSELRKGFSIGYVGAVQQGQDIMKFLEALKSVRREIQITMYVAGPKINVGKDKDLEKAVVYLGMLRYQDSIDVMRNCSVLLLLGHPGGIQVSAKAFYYLAAKRPILVIKNNECDASSRLIHSYKRGISVRNEAQLIEEKLRWLYNLYREGNYEKEFDLDTEPVEYSWGYLISTLDNILSRPFNTLCK